MKKCSKVLSCLQIFGEQKIYNNFDYEYKISYNVTEECIKDRIEIYLTYNTNIMRKDIDFIAPNSVIIEPGEESISFLLKIRSKLDLQDLRISINPVTIPYIVGCSDFNIAVDLSRDQNLLECSEMFFFEPYFFKTKKLNNMRLV
ncbi:MAG: hypothetical protein KAH01_07240 [Caldisericia bacterium]|nr:hypothetical protein [Caldisericia bacterium]